MKTPRVTPLEGVSTYGAAIRVVWESRTARFRSENPQGFGIDERRFRVSLFIAFFYCAEYLLLFDYKIFSADMFPMQQHI